MYKMRTLCRKEDDEMPEGIKNQWKRSRLFGMNLRKARKSGFLILFLLAVIATLVMTLLWNMFLFDSSETVNLKPVLIISTRTISKYKKVPIISFVTAGEEGY